MVAILLVALGGGLGMLIGGVLYGLMGLATAGAGTGLWAAVAAGIVFGAGVGGMVGGVSATVATGDETGRDVAPPDHAAVGIRAGQVGAREHIEMLLSGLRPVRVERLATVEAEG